MDQKSLIDPALMESLGLEFDPDYEIKRRKNAARCMAYYKGHVEKNREAKRRRRLVTHIAQERRAASLYRRQRLSDYRKWSREYQARGRASLNDSYVRATLTNKFRKCGAKFSYAVVPPGLVEAQRESLALKRSLKSMKQNNESKETNESQETSNPA